MRRSIFLACVVTAAMAITASAAFASKPTRQDFSGTGTFTIDEACSFPVLVSYSSHEHGTTFYDESGEVRFVATEGSLFVTLTNTETGTSAKVNISGPGRVYRDGSGVFRGSTLTGPPSGGLFLVHGRISTDDSGDTVSQTGHTTDICAILA